MSQVSRQPGSRRTISDHIQNGTQLAALIQETSSVAVDSVQETRNSVEGKEDCGTREVDEGSDSQNYSQVTFSK